MHANSPGAFSLSVTIHALVVGIAVVLTLLVARHNEIKPLDFDLVDDKDIEIGDHFEMPGAPSANPGLKYHRSKVKLLPIPKPQPPETAEAVPEKGKSAAQSAKTPPKHATTSYDQFQKQNKKQLEQNQKATSRRTASAPGIDAKGIMDDLQKYAHGPRGDGGGTGGSKMMIAALDAYWGRLIRALKAAYDQPDNVSELLTARVSFFLAPDGSITAVRIIKSSGDPSYDESVLAAFREVRSIGAVPGGKSGTFEINFKMTD